MQVRLVNAKKREHSDVECSRHKTMKKRTMKVVLLLQLLLDGVAEVVLEIWQIFLQDVGLLVVDVGAFALAIFVGHWLVIDFDAEVVLGHVISLIEEDVADELCYVDVLGVALDVGNGQLVKFNVHNLFVFGFRRWNRLTLFIVIVDCFHFCDGCGHLVGCRQVRMIVVVPR